MSDAKHKLASLLFVIALVVILTITGVSMQIYANWFMPEVNTYTSYFTSMSGLSVDNEVKIKELGVTVGKITNVELTDDNIIKVDYQVQRKYEDRIREDSVAIRQTMLPMGIGPAAISITLGSKSESIVKDGRIIPSSETEEGKALLNLKRYQPEAGDPVSTILENVASLTGKFSDPYGPLAKILDHVESITRQLETGNGIQKIYRSPEFYEKIIEMMGTVQVALNNVEAISGKAVYMVNDVTGLVKGATKTVEGVLSKTEESIQFLLNEIQMRILSILEDVSVMLQSILRETITNADPVTKQVFQTLSKSVDEILITVNALISQISKDITKVSGEGTALVANATGDVDAIMAAIKGILEKVNKLLARLQSSPLLPGTEANIPGQSSYIQRDLRTD